MSRRRRMHLEISERKVFLQFFDLVWVLLALYLASSFLQLDYYRISADFWTWTFVLGGYLLLFASVFELYDLQKASRYDTVLKNVVLATSVTVLFFLLTPFLTPVLPDNRLQIIYFYLAIVLALLLWRFAYIRLVSAPRFDKRVLIIGDFPNVDQVAGHLQRGDPHYSVIGYVSIHNEGDLPENKSCSKISRFSQEDLTSLIRRHKIDEILLSEVETEGHRTLNDQIFVLLKRGFPVKDYSMVYEEKTHRIPVQNIERNFYKFFRFSRSHDHKLYLFFTRCAEIIISVVGLIIGLLLVPLIFLINLVANRGKLFYEQERVGKNGEIFQMVKFRTMRCDAETNGAQWAQKNDVRITRFGKFLRRSRIDEFPQFYNILIGDMGLIGPRPERPVFVEELSGSIPFYDTRHSIKPGLTGWAQVMTEYADSHADSLEKLQYDLYYIKHRNPFLDITILTKTLTTIIFFRGQ